MVSQTISTKKSFRAALSAAAVARGHGEPADQHVAAGNE